MWLANQSYDGRLNIKVSQTGSASHRNSKCGCDDGEKDKDVWIMHFELCVEEGEFLSWLQFDEVGLSKGLSLTLRYEEVMGWGKYVLFMLSTAQFSVCWLNDTLPGVATHA